MKRPTVKSPCAADNYANPGERIIEVQFPDGASCLIALRHAMGTNAVEAYKPTGAVSLITPDGDMLDLEDEA